MSSDIAWQLSILAVVVSVIIFISLYNYFKNPTKHPCKPCKHHWYVSIPPESDYDNRNGPRCNLENDLPKDIIHWEACRKFEYKRFWKATLFVKYIFSGKV